MDKQKFQIYYGVILTLVGFAVFYRIPDAMVKIQTIDFFSGKELAVKVCIALLGVALIVAGVQKIYKFFK